MTDQGTYLADDLVLITKEAFTSMPWKNGLGVTQQIYLHKDAEGVRFRISQAAVVKDGVFSDFAGLKRTLVLLSDTGMTLSHRNKLQQQYRHPLQKALDMATFSGADQTVAELHQGAIEDLNIMVRDKDSQAQVQACYGLCTLHANTSSPALLRAFYVHQDCELATNKKSYSIAQGSFVILNEGMEVSLITGQGVEIGIYAK
ncbi:HutD/Ves family protein [Marinomonas sp.]